MSTAQADMETRMRWTRVGGDAPASAPTANPPWASVVQQRLEELSRLPPDWDSYGALPVRRDAGEALQEVLSFVMHDDTPPPSVVPTPAGHLQVEWHTKGIDLEVEIISPTEIAVFFDDVSETWDDVLTLDLSRLMTAVDRLSE